MRKFKLFAILLVLLLATASFGDYRSNRAFLATAHASIALSTTVTNGTDFTSRVIPCPTQIVAITISFTGDGSMDGGDIDFFFQASYDNGSTFSTDSYVEIDVASNADHSSNAVKHTELVNVYGVSHLRLWKIVNNDATSSITLANATISWGER